MIEYVWTAAQKCPELGRVLVATDDQRIFETVTGFGGEAVMTRGDFQSGTDRIASVVAELEGIDVVVNLQGDEPLLTTAHVERLLDALDAHPECGMSTLAVRRSDRAEIQSPHVVKVAVAGNGRALYFSREPIGATASGEYLKHIGVYAYRKDVLLRLCQKPPSPLELAERLEQLRALENNIPIAVAILHEEEDTIAVDVPEDIAKVERRLLERRKGDGQG